MVSRGDVIESSLLGCVVAADARRAAHSYLKNGFALHSARALASWIQDTGAMREFEDLVQSVANELSGFSGGNAVPLISPLNALPVPARERIVRALNVAFEKEFNVQEHRRLITARLSELMGLVRAFSAACEESGVGERLMYIREAAAELRATLEALPQGFLLPQSPPGSGPG